ncbi:hypothetical protein B296_00014945 [Ensete ventricosum]|uniref:Uncharacterized protein n=1 Tax=Ensete ventricosum TaxID=4639 RepID=A0A427ACB7_ENSVE|nr:hypothetical protein B296_00014945 [Ensete ventricosum]
MVEHSPCHKVLLLLSIVPFFMFWNCKILEKHGEYYIISGRRGPPPCANPTEVADDAGEGMANRPRHEPDALLEGVGHARVPAPRPLPQAPPNPGDAVLVAVGRDRRRLQVRRRRVVDQPVPDADGRGVEATGGMAASAGEGVGGGEEAEGGTVAVDEEDVPEAGVAVVITVGIEVAAALKGFGYDELLHLSLHIHELFLVLSLYCRVTTS